MSTEFTLIHHPYIIHVSCGHDYSREVPDVSGARARAARAELGMALGAWDFHGSNLQGLLVFTPVSPIFAV